MASDQPEWPAFSWHAWEPITKKMIPIKFEEWAYVDDMDARELEWRGAVPYIHRDAARAWQAFRDFLNGTPEQWQERVDEVYVSAYDEGASACCGRT